jgi:hypothetical protein
VTVPMVYSFYPRERAIKGHRMPVRIEPVSDQ